MNNNEGLNITEISRGPTVNEAERTAPYLKKIAKNAGISASGRMLGFIFGPITALVTTRALGPELYGVYALATYWSSIFAEVSRLGFGRTLIRFIGIYKGEDRLDKAKGATLLTLRLAIFIGGILTAAMFLFAGPFCSHVLSRADIADAFRFYSFAILFTAVYGTVISALTGFQEQRYVVLANSVYGSIFKLGSLILLLVLGLKLYAALASSLIQDVAILVIGAFFLVRVFPALRDKTLTPTTETRELWRFSGILFATSMFNKYTVQLDLLFLGMFRSLGEVGLYALALRLQPLIYLPHYAISQIFGPIVAELHARGEIQEMDSIYKTVTKWTASFSVPIFLTIAFFHEPILSFFGKEFHGAAMALVILGLGNSLADMFGLSGQVITMIGRPGVNLINSIITTCISVSLYIFLIPRNGVVGAAAAYFVSIAFVNVLRMIQVYRFLRIHPFKGTLWKVFAAASFSVAALLSVRSLSFPGQLSGGWLLEIAFLWFVYASVMWVLRLDADDILILKTLKRRIMANRI